MSLAPEMPTRSESVVEGRYWFRALDLYYANSAVNVKENLAMAALSRARFGVFA
jgi:hypothetical protein